MLRLRDIKYLYEWQWHQESDKCNSSDTEKRSEMHDVYRYRWDIHSVYNEATKSNHNNKHSKYSKNDEIRALSNEYIYR